MKGPSRSPSPLLPTLAIPPPKFCPQRATKWLVAAVGTVSLVALVHSQHPLPLSDYARHARQHFGGLGRDSTCEDQGLFSRDPAWLKGSEERHRVTVRVAPSPFDLEDSPNQENTILSTPFHPTLATAHPLLFPSQSSDEPASPPSLDPPHSLCKTPTTHYLPLHLPPSTLPVPPAIFFSLCTTPARALSFADIWTHYLSAPPPPPTPYFSSSQPPPKAPGCIVINAENGDMEIVVRTNEALEKAGTACVMRESGLGEVRYEMRVLGAVKDAWDESERRRWEEGERMVEWFVFGDDDTWWVDQATLGDLVAQFDWRRDHILGGFSDAEDNFRDHGLIAYGGAGIIISRNLVRKMQGLLPLCIERFANVFGGDGLITNCAALAKGVPLSSVVEEVPGMSQMDIRGDAAGFLSSGQTPFISLHHWVGWLQLLPHKNPIEAIGLLTQASEAVGGRNFLRRWVFDEGRVTWSVGYSVIVHREALTRDDLERTEHTWSGFQPRHRSRSPRLEGSEKLTYFLDSVIPVSSTRTIFRHVCTHESVQDGVREIDIMWDETRTKASSWSWKREGGRKNLEDGAVKEEEKSGSIVAESPAGQEE